MSIKNEQRFAKLSRRIARCKEESTLRSLIITTLTQQIQLSDHLVGRKNTWASSKKEMFDPETYVPCTKYGKIKNRHIGSGLKSIHPLDHTTYLMEESL